MLSAEENAVAYAVGAGLFAVIAVVVSVVGGPRRRGRMTLGVQGGRVRLPSRTLERVLLVACCIAVVVIVSTLGRHLDRDRAAVAFFATAWSASVVVFAIRRGAFMALRPGVGADRFDDGYVDAETDGRPGV